MSGVPRDAQFLGAVAGETGGKLFGRIVAALGVRPDEAARLRVVMVSSFLLGMSLVLYYSASNAIFLTHYGIAKLPYVYIVNGVLVVIFGVGISLLGRRVMFRTQTLAVNFLLSATILLLWVGMRFNGSDVVIFAAAAWFRLLFIYTTVGLWEVAARLFDIRQGKRLFALVGLGVMLAAVVGGVLTPLIVAAVGTTNLLLLAAMFLAFYAFSLSRALHTVSERRRDAGRNRRQQLGPLVRDRYIRSIFGLKTFSVLTAYLIEYVFYDQASLHYANQGSLAGFLGSFTGLTTLVMVVVSALVTGRLISSRGVRATLFVMPTVMTATALATTLDGAFAGAGTAFFVLVVVTMFSNQVLDKAVDTPALVLLFQPMPPERRLPVRMIVEGWLGSVALILSGALLLLVTWLHPPNAIPFVALLVLVSVAFLLQTREATSQYARALRRATSRGFTKPPEERASGAEPVSVLLELLRTGRLPAEQEKARAALRSRSPRIGHATLAAEVQVQVAGARSLLAAERDLSVAWPLLGKSVHEELARVRANVFSLLCCSRDVDGAPLTEILLDAEARIAAGSADDRANAVELLDVVLAKSLKRPVVALVEDHGPDQALRKLDRAPVPAVLRPRERLALLARDPSLGSWTASLIRLSVDERETGSDMSDALAPKSYPPDIASVVWLRSIDIFARVPYQLLSELAARLRPCAVSAGVRIVTEGEEGEELYLVRSGTVAVQRADGGPVAQLGPGSVFGELAVLDPAPRSADVVAWTDADLLILDRTTLVDLMGKQPEVASDIITMLVRRLRARTADV
ncbi:MAG: cyclic nucleotide-binding domain-containing protein [Actinomycetota bacterium]|nr:cyclic nucleotide-binding domain-containing protein [Actinomycetota bacterium]